MREYDRFEKGAANSNISTARAQAAARGPGRADHHHDDPEARHASSTQNKGHAIYDGHVVMIFDECHRSQFGDMHTAITKAFKRYHLFGFTGTPIFAENAGTGGNPQLRTTEQAFGDRLHTYTIVDAINDKNVLPFRIDYVNTIKLPADLDRQAGLGDRHRAGAARPGADRPGRRLHPASTSTRRPSAARRYTPRRASGVARLQLAVRHRLDRRRQALLRRVRAGSRRELPDRHQRLKVGLIYSYAANEDDRRRLPRRGGVRDRRAGRKLARLPRGGDPGLQRACSARASTPRPTSSRTTTRTCRCG